MALLILNDDGIRKEFVVGESVPTFVGRIKECECCLHSPGVSRQHAVLIQKNSVCGIKDLGSVNGTYVNGRRIETSVRLFDGDIIQIAEYTFEFSSGDSTATRIFMDQGLLEIRQDSSPQEHPDVPASAHPAGMPPHGPEDRGTRENDHIPGPAFPSAGPVNQPDPVRRASPDPGPATVDDAAKGNVRIPESVPGPTEIAPPSPAGVETRAHAVPPEDSDGRDDREECERQLLEAVDDADLKFVDDGEEDDRTETPEVIPSSDDASEKRDAALNRAAAEAGIVGEFAPDLEDPPQGAAVETDKKTRALPLSPGLRDAIEARLSLYALLDGLAADRQAVLSANPALPENVRNEFARQDREKSKLPTAEQARSMQSKREARRKDLEEKRKTAKETGEAPPPRPSPRMAEAEAMADSQWSLIISSEEGAFRAAIDEAAAICAGEPLLKEFSGAKIDAKFIMGGGVYYLALEGFLEEAQARRKRIQADLANAAPKKAGFRLFANHGQPDDDEEEEDETPRVDPAKLQEEDQALASRISGINQELADLEKALIKSFWSVYAQAALFFIPRFDSMPWVVRAFLRHGAVGFAPWWMPDDVREHIRRDCAEDVRGTWDKSPQATHIVYADEYLRAVVAHDCTPALDENLELNEKNSPNWKADKALRRLIYSRSQFGHLDWLLAEIDGKISRLQGEHDQLAEQVRKILPGMKNEKQQRRELQQKQQGLKVEMSKINKLAEKIRTQTLPQIREAVSDTEKRFDDGELPRPDRDFIIRRECDAAHKIARLLANLKERFMPLVVRDYSLDTDAMNDRISIAAEIADIERRDPALFLETLVPSKKRRDRIDLRVCPTIVILPSAGLLAYSWNPRGGPENGRLAIPTCFIRQRLRERQMTYLFADFRWDTSKAGAGMDLMTSDTIVAAFMTVRWDWRKRSKEAREKGLIFNDQNDRTNWRRVYEAYIQTAMDAGKKLYNRNYDFYERIIGKYFDLPEGLTLLKK